MLNALNTKILIGIVILLWGIASYFASERQQKAAEQKKVDQAVQRMKSEYKQVAPANWGTVLKNK